VRDKAVPEFEVAKLRLQAKLEEQQIETARAEVIEVSPHVGAGGPGGGFNPPWAKTPPERLATRRQTTATLLRIIQAPLLAHRFSFHSRRCQILQGRRKVAASALDARVHPDYSASVIENARPFHEGEALHVLHRST
jgi:hypothetical protein